MNGRTCQLCGKPLSRIWAGSGGDFCSREHRNQYRLRCGMDTLLEANKHASLMRRRDQPRQFPAALLRCSSAVEPHSFGPAALALPRPLLRGLPAASAPANATFDTGESAFLPPRATGSLRSRFAAKPKIAVKATVAQSRPVTPLPARFKPLGASLAQAQLTALRFGKKVKPGPRRSFVMLAQRARRTRIPDNAFRALGVGPAGNIAGRRPLNMKFAAKVGHAFRVSSKNTFRHPAMNLTRLALPAPAAQGIKWPETLPLPGVAYIGQAILPYPEERDFRVAAVRPPAAPKFRDAAAIRIAPTIPLRPAPARDAQVGARLFAWRSSSLDGHLAIRDSGLRAGQSSVGPNCKALKLVPAGSGATQRVESARFEPQDQAMINMSYSWNASR